MMGKYTGKMIISDLDGTLIPRGGVISPENKAAIEEFVKGGGSFAIATGRTPEAAAGYVKGLPINAPSVFFNGAMLYDWEQKKVIKT
ncbi:MAG TPA: haloacid dehalogenase, partial [Anaerovibrio sp.]|nr:haloacid dehalogenase [Anaerovibrio sp.]